MVTKHRLDTGEVRALNTYVKLMRATESVTARDVIDKLFFSDKRYDLGEVGRYWLKISGQHRDSWSNRRCIAYWSKMVKAHLGENPGR